MQYKSDWEAAKKRLSAFWEHELYDRCCINVRAGDEKLGQLMDEFWEKNNRDIRLVRTDPQRLIEQNRIMFEHTYFGGEALPIANLDLGASGHAGFFKGANYQISDTVWFFPSLEDLNQLEFDENSYLYQKTLEHNQTDEN